MKCQNFALRHSVHNFTLTLSPLVNQMIYTSPLILPCICSMNIVSPTIRVYAIGIPDTQIWFYARIHNYLVTVKNRETTTSKYRRNDRRSSLRFPCIITHRLRLCRHPAAAIILIRE